MKLSPLLLVSSLAFGQSCLPRTTVSSPHGNYQAEGLYVENGMSDPCRIVVSASAREHFVSSDGSGYKADGKFNYSQLVTSALRDMDDRTLGCYRVEDSGQWHLNVSTTIEYTAAIGPWMGTCKSNGNDDYQGRPPVKVTK